MQVRATKIVGVGGIAFEVEPVEGADGLYVAYSERNGVAAEFDVTTGELTGKGSRKHGEAIKTGIQRAIKSWEKEEQGI
ncbi:hypothetical protein P4H71_25985 [Paenibacillus kribbensis]|uniref:hypothetical protein n=1 Tax=Paenibacillus kribbensis TaxID=172713 RepID=UPI002DB7BE45|nr:hypothetical protein [Paenibacillus kribbensis]MEC0237771.1 hypothetical protein [Paenibacillus kribbensis]